MIIEFNIDEFDNRIGRDHDEAADLSYLNAKPRKVAGVFFTRQFAASEVVIRVADDGQCFHRREASCGCVSPWGRDRHFRTTAEAISFAQGLLATGYKASRETSAIRAGKCLTHLDHPATWADIERADQRSEPRPQTRDMR
jgi:hypothetical protein